MRQRRSWSASLKAGFSAAVSARALIMRTPTLLSFAQFGTKPHLMSEARRTGA
jgi:hypothetical protein